MLAVDLLDAARELRQFLSEMGWSYALIGGLALAIRARARATANVDVSVLCELGSERLVIDPLLERFRARVDDAADFALQNGILLLSASNGVALDVGLALFPFEAETIQRATLAKLADDLELPVVTHEDLIFMKSIAGRPQDWADIDSLILYADRLDWPVIEARLKSVSELIDFDDIVEQLQQLRARRSPIP